MKKEEMVKEWIARTAEHYAEEKEKFQTMVAKGDIQDAIRWCGGLAVEADEALKIISRVDDEGLDKVIEWLEQEIFRVAENGVHNSTSPWANACEAQQLTGKTRLLRKLKIARSFLGVEA